MTRLLICLFALAISMGLSLTFPSLSQAGGPVHGAKAAAMGTAFVAIADDPSAITHNPAGLSTLKGTNIYGGVVAVVPSSSYTSPEGGTEKTAFQAFFPPQFYISSDFGLESVVLGLGIYSPFGIGGRKWSDTGLTRFASTDGAIATIAASPAIAWRILPQVAVAAGVDVFYASNSAAAMVDQSALGAGDGRLSFKGWGLGVGYNLGILLFPGGKVSFGFTYRSGVRVKQEGTLALERIAPALHPLFGGDVFRTDASTVVNFPEIFSWGLAFRPNSKLTVGVDVDWARWSSFDESVLSVKNQVPAARFGDIPINFQWEDAMAIKIGAEYRLSDCLALRGGYAFVETPVPGDTLNPDNPDSDQHNVCAGFGYKIRGYDLDVFYIAGIFHNRTSANAILSGEYKNFVHYAGFSLGRKF
ncbi:MAG: hypothetical protein C4567_14845 [Deltaproteobacteria bacterium]|nr:MAG: hypothetical protein C4567_14845 [Deltaproteobacteria bacterium]